MLFRKFKINVKLNTKYTYKFIDNKNLSFYLNMNFFPLWIHLESVFFLKTDDYYYNRQNHI